MLVLPNSPAIVEVLYEWVDAEGNPIAIWEVAEVGVETNRGRGLGNTTVLLVDLPWSACSFFRRPIALRREAAERMLRVSVEDQVGRPKTSDVWAAAEQWLGERDDDVLQEYLSAQSEPGGEDPVAAAAAAAAEDQTMIIQQLQARVLELEGAGGAAAPAGVPATAKAAPQELFPMTMAGGGINAEDWQQLQRLAGPAPRRQPRAETSAARAAEYDLQAEVGLEAQEEQTLVELSQQGDPLHRLLALQMQQTQAILARIGPKHADPLSSALAGSSDLSGSSSGGKGAGKNKPASPAEAAETTKS
eukprot:Skav225444  [mRNA]  locus=scaffold1668:237192:238658:- [translate_table: standard]